MKGYGQFCPVAKASEILAQRWTFLVIRELLSGSRRYNDIRRGVPRMSPTLLGQRLKELEKVGVIERLPGAADGGGEYQLTEAGLALRPVVMQLATWGHRWTYTKYRREDLDAGFLMWSIRRCLKTALLPRGRTVVYVEFSDRVPLRRWWLVVEAGEADLCVKDPGHEVNLYLHTDLITLTKYFDARMTLAEAASSGRFRLQGSSELIRGIGQWLGRPADQSAEPAAA